MPSVYISSLRRGSATGGDFQQVVRGADDFVGGDEPEAVMVPLGADALEAGAAREVGVQDPAWDLPGSVLGVRERVEVEDGRPNRRGDVGRAGVVGDE